MTRKTTTQKDARKEVPDRRRPDAVRSPRPVWEPEPLQIPLPRPEDRPRQSKREDSPRGVVIIQYGDE